MAEICSTVFTQAPARASEKRGEIPAELDALIARAVARDKEERFSDAKAFADALAPFCEGPSTGRSSRHPLSTSLPPAR